MPNTRAYFKNLVRRETFQIRAKTAQRDEGVAGSTSRSDKLFAAETGTLQQKAGFGIGSNTPSPKLLDYAVNLLSYRPRSEREISFRLKRKQATAAEIEAIVNTLKEMKLLNDQEFCLWWQEARDKHRPRSSRILKLELRKKGIARTTIDQTIDSSTEKEQTRAHLALQKKYGRRQSPQGREKIIRFLASRGFSWDIISGILKPPG